MSAVDNAREHLEGKIDELRSTYGVLALSGVLVRDGGDTVVVRSQGIRKADVGRLVQANQVVLSDRFNIGSTTKPFTGYLIAYLVQSGVLGWKTTLADVFPELDSPVFRTRYLLGASYRDKTVEQLMTHSAGMGYGPSPGPEDFSGSLTGASVDEYATIESEMLRRYNYMLSSLREMPIATPTYGGGSIICGAIAERLTGESYEALMDKHVFARLGMVHAGFGRLATNGTPDGIWQHSHDPATGSVVPDQVTMTIHWGFHSHAPAGAVHVTAGDMSRFIVANLPQSGKAKLAVNDAQLVISQQSPINEVEGYARAGWSAHDDDGHGRYLEHNGDNGKSYSWLRIYPAHNFGVAAMTNVGGDNGSTIGATAVQVLRDSLVEMNDNWEWFLR